jgi:WD40 repeat protein
MPQVVHHERALHIESAHNGIVWPVFLAGPPDDEVLLVSGAAHPDHHLRRWNASTGDMVWQTRDGDLYEGCFGLALARGGGRQILAAATDMGVKRWDARTGDLLPGPPELSPGTVWGVATCDLDDGRVMLVGAGNDHLVRRWDALTGTVLGEPLHGHASSVKCVTTGRVPGHGLLIAAGGDDGTVRLWRAADGNALATFTAGGEVLDVDLLVPAAGEPVLTCGDSEGVLHLWNPVSGERLGHPLETGEMIGSLTSVEVAGEPRLLASSESGVVRQWHATTGRMLQSLRGISVAALSRPDGTVLLATGLENGEIHIKPLVSP